MKDVKDVRYRGSLFPEQPTIEQVREASGDYVAIALEVMRAIVDRYERNPDYGWIDTKIHLVSGRDFSEEELIRGPRTVYGWIQGRGLEALVGHARWFRNHLQGPEIENLLQQMDCMIREILGRILSVRERNCGHVFFYMTPEGEPFLLSREGGIEIIRLEEDTPYNFSDLFCAKGMLRAAEYLGDIEARGEAELYCEAVDQAIWSETFRSDQQSADPQNPIQPVAGRLTHGPRMIQVGTAALLCECTRDSKYVEFGLRLVRHILDRYVNLEGRWPNLQEYDFVEFLDGENRPYRQHGEIVSDPGHALEFVGLSLKFLSTVREKGLASEEQLREIETLEGIMPSLLRHLFGYGFQDGPGGICKAFGLLRRTVLNAEMPWWSLPETMRAALYCWNVADTAEKPACLDVLRACHNAFIRHYVRPELHLMAVQTRNARGEVVDSIPATSDADPGYHTGLCLLDCLDVVL